MPTDDVMVRLEGDPADAAGPVPAERIAQPLWYFPPRDEWPGRLGRAAKRTARRLRPLAASVAIHVVGVFLGFHALGYAVGGLTTEGGNAAAVTSSDWGGLAETLVVDSGIDGVLARHSAGGCPAFPATAIRPGPDKWPVVDAPPPAADLTAFSQDATPLPTVGPPPAVGTPAGGSAAGAAADPGRANGEAAARVGAAGFGFDNVGAAPDVHTVVFFCDVSFPTLSNPWPLLEALKQAVAGLRPDQSFNVILQEGGTRLALSQAGPVPATAAAKRQAAELLDGFSTGGIPDSIPALRLAWRRKPDLVCLVADGDFADNNAVLAEVRRLNADKSAWVETTAYITARETGDDVLGLLKTIAAENGGQFHVVRLDQISP